MKVRRRLSSRQRRWAATLTVLAAGGCSPPPPRHAADHAIPHDRPQRAAAPEPAAVTPSAVTDAEPAPLPQLPLQLPYDWDVEEGAQQVRLVHAPLDVTFALVYLHGKCGDIDKLDSWADTLSEVVTVVALRGSIACGGGRHRWEPSLPALHERIQTALRAVKTLRAGHLDTSRVVLFGYSQGASRAEGLAALAPSAYPWVILGGAPGAPRADRLKKAQAVFVFGGTREPTAHMVRGVGALAAAGLRARFEPLAGAGHGEYVADTEPLLREALRWLRGG